MKLKDYQIIVAGGGHAGVEAALAAARMGMHTLLVTPDKQAIARMSCNPAIGGLAKGHLVAEIDALGGEMAKVIDKTGLQFKVLNRSKGRAVWSPRAQADKIAYSQEMRRRLENQENLSIIEDTVTAVFTENGRVIALHTDQDGPIDCSAAIITSGTFLNGLIHIGLENFPGGRLGEKAVKGLTESLHKAGIQSGRLKTGTPPRIKADTIDYSKTTPQYGDDNPTPFSFQTKSFHPKNIPCFITRTSPETHAILMEGIDRSPLYTGRIKGIGPRYCPSIEDKIVRFPDRNSHQIFLEPEWEDANQIYVNGFSTSLPVDIQIRGLRSIEGMEDAEIIHPGYAIVYDFFPSRQLKRTLETKRVTGLYLAGQVNGTSGYEEAAALGLMAGINASLKILGSEPFTLDRSEAYIGVLIDDLIVKNPTEPYRMFTSSAEYRLLLRFDNADQRLSEKGFKIGLINRNLSKNTRTKKQLIREVIQFMRTEHIAPNTANPILSTLGSRTISSGISLHKFLRRPEVRFEHIKPLLPDKIQKQLQKYRDVEDQIALEVTYEGYIRRQEQQVAAMKRDENLAMPPNMDYQQLSSITKEAREKLSAIRPETIGQAARIPGVSPADITALLILLKK